MTKAIDLKLEKYMHAVRYRLFQDPVRSLFPRIPNFERRYFALQRFVAALRDKKRGANWIASRWAMTEDQFLEWKDSADFSLQSRELRGIKRRFTAAQGASAAFRLGAGSRFRSLDSQIHNWNENGPVGLHAPRMTDRARKEIKSDTDYPDLGPYLSEGSGLLSFSVTPASNAGLAGMPGIASSVPASDWQQRNDALERFIAWLAKQKNGKPAVTVATPGLSSHGIGQAVDFRVVRASDGKRILGAGNPGAWRSTGWATNLANAIRPSRHFHGPLKIPDEPWHWTFDPD